MKIKLMKYLALVFLLSFSYSSYAKEYVGDKILQIDEYRFTPHITADAITRKQWGIAFQQSVGANLNTSAILKSLTVAVTDRVEVGTVPIYYFLEDHIFNISVKYNFWRAREFAWALGLSSAFFDIEDSSLNNKSLTYNVSALQLLLNYFPEWTRLTFGLNVNIIDDSVRGLKDGESTSLATGDPIAEVGVDISYDLKEDIDITFGFGFARESGVTSFEDVHFGLGASARWYRPNKLLSTPTVGFHYAPDIKDLQFLISTAIY